MKPTCRKCGRVLTSPESIARGMGPECAGDSGTRRRVRTRSRRGGGRRYDAVGGGHAGQQTLSLFAGFTPQPAGPLPIAAAPMLTLPPAQPAAPAQVRAGKKAQAAVRKERRAAHTQAFHARQPFSVGLAPNLTDFVPVEGGWQNVQTGRFSTHDDLRRYLERYGFIDVVRAET